MFVFHSMFGSVKKTTTAWESIPHIGPKSSLFEILETQPLRHLTLIGMSSENNKNAYLQHHLETLFIRLNEFGQIGEINLIDVNFHLQKNWNFLIQIQLTKSDLKRTRGWKVPCLMPIRVNSTVLILLATGTLSCWIKCVMPPNF